MNSKFTPPLSISTPVGNLLNSIKFLNGMKMLNSGFLFTGEFIPSPRLHHRLVN